MSFATSNRTRISYVFEATPGVTPPTPEFQDLNYTSEDINANLETVISETIREDRMVSDLVRVQKDNSGSLNFEVQNVAYDPLLEAALQGTWSTPQDYNGSLDAISATSRFSDPVTFGTAFANVVDYQWIKVGGFSNSANNGWHQVINKISNDEVVVASTLIDESIPVGGTVKGSMLRNGVIARSMTIEKLFNDTTVPTYFYFRGMEISALTLTAETGAILTGSFSFIGRTSEGTETEISGATHLPPSTNTILNAVNSIGSISKNGQPSSSTFQNLNLTLDNNSRGQTAIGTDGYVGAAHGSINLTGTTSIYFEDINDYNDFNNGTSFSLSFILSSPDGDMVVTLPQVKFSSMTIVSSGINTDIITDSEFTAIIDPSSNSQIQLDVAV